MRAGVGNLHLTYADTLGDLAAGSIGGALGAWLAVSLTSRWWSQDIRVPIQVCAGQVGLQPLPRKALLCDREASVGVGSSAAKVK